MATPQWDCKPMGPNLPTSSLPLLPLSGCGVGCCPTSAQGLLCSAGDSFCEARLTYPNPSCLLERTQAEV